MTLGNFTTPGRYYSSSDGFAPPNFGGTLAVMFNTVAYTDTTAKALFTLPRGAVIVSVAVNVETAFNDTGTDLLDIGISTDADKYAVNLDVSSAGQIVTGFVASELLQFGTPLTADVTVQATYTGSNADPSAGLAQIVFTYCLFT